MNDIEFRLFRAAVAVAEELSFGQAAERLRISQPGLTKQIQELEARLKIKLFERDTQKVELTEAGKAFVAQAKLALLYHRRAVEAAQAAVAGAEAILNIGQSPFIDPYLTGIVFSTQLPYNPNLHLQSSSDYSPNLVRMVTNGELDVAVVAEGGESKQVGSFLLDRSPFYVLLEAESPLARNETISLRQMHGFPWVLFSPRVHPHLYEALSERATEVGAAAKEMHHATTAEQAAQLVQRTGGVAVLTKRGAWKVAVDGLTMRPLHEADIEVRTVLTARLDANRIVGEFVRTVVRRVETMTAAQQRPLLQTG
jgi:DNA-binding transcriptional LysR family regulator